MSWSLCDTGGCVGDAFYQLTLTSDESPARLEMLCCERHLKECHELVMATLASLHAPGWYVRTAVLQTDREALAN